MKEIQLTQGKFALVDDEDYENLMQWKWYAKVHPKHIYAEAYFGRNGEGYIYEKMHRILLNLIDSLLEIDHWDGNGLNNQKYNLRICTGSQNQHNSRIRKDNSTGFKGVFFHKKNKKWTAQIVVKGIPKYLGSFDSPENAAEAYDKEAANIFGEYALTNSTIYKNES